MNAKRMMSLLCLLTVGPCAVHGADSIVISGGRRSIIISGRDPEPVQAIVSVPSVEPQKGSDPPSTSPVVKGPSQQDAQQAAGEVFRTVVNERYLISEEWCPHCPAATSQFLRSGGKPENVITIKQARDIGYRNPNWSGGIPHEFTLQRVVESRTQPQVVSKHVVQSRNTADQPSNYTEAQRQIDINHLLTHRSHAGKFSREYLESLSGYQLIDLHNTDHGVPTSKGVKTNTVVTSQKVATTLSPPVRYIQWPGWGTIDLESYNRNCSCSMCNSIRSMQQEYWRQLKAFQQSQTSVSPDQEGTPHALVEVMLDSMQLRSDDILGDMGCGDGRICIAAARRGIRSIGVELDPERADVARRNVRSAGLEHMVTIETGDALEFDTSRCTAITAYLYPPLLAKLSPRLTGLRVVASPFHQIPGLPMSQAGDVWIYRSVS